MAARLAAQERQIEALSEEISRLRDAFGGGGCFNAELARGGAELEDLRSENEKLRYRHAHLQRALRAELELEKQQGQGGARTGREKKTNALESETPKVNAPQKVGLLLSLSLL